MTGKPNANVARVGVGMRNVKPGVVFGLEPLVLPIDDVRPNPRNARTHSPDQVEQIASSIREYGWTYPLLIDENNLLIAGHGRLLAAQSMCYTHVPAFRIDHLSEAQKRTLMIADNRIPEKAEWNFDTLALELTALQDAGEDLSLTGWSPEELSDIAAMSIPGGLEEIDEAGEPDEKPAPEPDGTEDWQKLHMKLPPETLDVFWDLMHKVQGKPHQQFEALLAAVDVMALEELARTESVAGRR